MAWYRVLLLFLALAGAASVWYMLRVRSGGTAACIGCGECLRAGECTQVRKGRKMLKKAASYLDKNHKTGIIVSIKEQNAVTKSALRYRPSERGDGESPLPTPQSSRFGAVREERNGSSPLLDG